MLLNKDRFGKLTSKSLDSIAAIGLREADAELPCLIYTNNSIILSPKTARKPLNPADSMQLKTIISLRQNVEYFIEKYGYNNVGFLVILAQDCAEIWLRSH